MRFLSILIILLSSASRADLILPRNLTESDQQTVTKILGFSSSTKILGDPYPLGGYSGLEFGLAYEFLPTSEIASLGDKAAVQSEVSYMNFVIGKGLYNNLDFFFQVSPFRQGENLTNYGAQLRWGLYQAKSIPAYLTMVASVNSVNFDNQVVLTNQNYDLLAGFNVQDLTLYAGLGSVRSIGTFLGGPSGVTATGSQSVVSVIDSHYVVGMSIKRDKLFLSLQFDRYVEAVYSAKFGLRL